MQWASVNDLREKYLSFFESKGHLRLPSFPLVPINDKSLLLINSGMAPMKKFFTGEVEPPRHRVTTCQKCIRTPDLERVGHTARHGTFFEMLGNFSFGDYFKNEAIPWAWEFLTKTLEIPEDKLYPSVYEEDDEAFELWNKVIGVPAERITRLGKEDNFWEHGAGPCGPCSEIYFDRGEKYGCGKPDCGPGCDCDRFMEIWNNVFSQFNNMGDGTYTELEHKNIDTGMGLDRLACVMQGVDNMFEVDGVRKILDKVVEISGKSYGCDQDNDISIRVITDHVRGATFMISDGVIPSNEGRGYVLRRILRRAARHGKLLGIDRMFLTEVCDVVIAENVAGYPELGEKAAYIKKVMSIEEERFNATIDAGLSKLSQIIEDAKAAGAKKISGEDSFKLYDTYGFPIDLTREIAEEAGFELDDDRFAELRLGDVVLFVEAAEQLLEERAHRVVVEPRQEHVPLVVLHGLDREVDRGIRQLFKHGPQPLLLRELVHPVAHLELVDDVLDVGREAVEVVDDVRLQTLRVDLVLQRLHREGRGIVERMARNGREERFVVGEPRRIAERLLLHHLGLRLLEHHVNAPQHHERKDDLLVVALLERLHQNIICDIPQIAEKL